jgi:hypothetical protein
MPEDIDVEQLVENIGEANPQGDQGEQIAEGGQPQGLTFGGLDDLLKHKLEYTANGRSVSEDIATILKRASQGYNYAQLAHELKEREAHVSTQAQTATETQEKWAKFENFAKENPAWYEHWSAAWEQRNNPVGEQPADAESGGFDDSRITALLEQKLEPIREFMTKQQAQSEQLHIREQDQALDQEIKETRGEFPSIDFDKSDPETGKTLQWEVLNFANEKGMGFRDAFKVFYHDKLLASRMEEEKAKWAKDQEANMRKGILGETPTSDGKTPIQPDLSKSTWDQVAEYAGKQLGFMS